MTRPVRLYSLHKVRHTLRHRQKTPYKTTTKKSFFIFIFLNKSLRAKRKNLKSKNNFIYI